MSKKRKICLYARVSTDQQTGGLEAQVRALKEYCTLNKVEEYELFTDEGISGTKSSRPALDRMMAAVRNDEVSSVVVYSFSRFARSVTHMLVGLEELKKHQTNFVSLTERIDTDSPIGKAVFVIIGAIAQLERDLIERVKKPRSFIQERLSLLSENAPVRITCSGVSEFQRFNRLAACSEKLNLAAAKKLALIAPAETPVINGNGCEPKPLPRTCDIPWRTPA